jgi:hypothetical protein
MITVCQYARWGFGAGQAARVQTSLFFDRPFLSPHAPMWTPRAWDWEMRLLSLCAEPLFNLSVYVILGRISTYVPVRPYEAESNWIL